MSGAEDGYRLTAEEKAHAVASAEALRSRLRDALAATDGDQREQLAKTVFAMDRRGLHVNRLWSELDGRQRGPYLRTADALLPVVERIANERAAAELRASASELDAKSAETWKAYKTASPDDPRRANPYYDGAADAYETAATRVLRRADALDPS